VTPPRSLLRGFDGSVLVPPSVAEELAPYVRSAIDAATRRDGCRLSDSALDVAAALEESARANRARRAEVVAVDNLLDSPRLSSGRVDPMHLSGHVAEVGPAEFAALISVTRQAILRRCARGTLPGAHKDAAGHWRIPLSALGGRAA
jgi:hypothetical protein